MYHSTLESDEEEKKKKLVGLETLSTIAITWFERALIDYKAIMTAYSDLVRGLGGNYGLGPSHALPYSERIDWLPA